jgi:hypothetical protein
MEHPEEHLGFATAYAKTTRQGYSSVIRLFFTYLISCGGLKQEFSLEYMTSLIEAGHLTKYLNTMVARKNTFRTILNNQEALSSFLVFLGEKIQSSKEFDNSQKTDLMATINPAKSTLAKISKSLSPRATTQTRARNTQDSLEKQGKWTTMGYLVETVQHIAKKAKALMEEKRILSEKEMAFMQKATYFLMTVLLPPLRKQNYDLSILKGEDDPRNPDAENGVIFSKDDRVLLQIAKYKTGSTYGLKVKEVTGAAKVCFFAISFIFSPNKPI